MPARTISTSSAFRRTTSFVAVIAAAATMLPLAADPPAAQQPQQAHQGPRPGEDVNDTPALPITPEGVRGVLYARPFILETPYETEWRAEHPKVAAGWLMVLEVNPASVFPRQVAEPILYVGKTTAERVNLGHQSGHVVVIVPSELNERGEPSLDLTQALMWFGKPGLPERVDAAKVESERFAAVREHIAPFAKDVIDRARAKAEGALRAADRTALRHAAAELIRAHSPQEAALADLVAAE